MAKGKFRLYCSDFYEAGFNPQGCCTSCHDEFDEGYGEPAERFPPGQDYSNYRTWAESCCSFQGATRHQWAVVLAKKRKEWKL